eukprot:TRINITY_DN4156_c1_g1_i1.p1 TRINITY_DN4156_c1_g1~~TRINITY_DN4156_c1_g1_i1.p1  ORF type:complete len:182 (-),score=26.28 TRINITY_DN4156_c1_g1_i1:1129-1632(-)
MTTFTVTCRQLHSINRINTEIWDRLKSKKRGNSLVVRCLAGLTFSEQCLSFVFTEQTLPLTLLEPFFHEINFFNDQLPKEDYDDLEPILRKYEVLNPLSSVPILENWKTALEKVQVYLGEKEQVVNTHEKLLQKVYKLFKIEEEAWWGRIYSENFSVQNNFLEFRNW